MVISQANLLNNVREYGNIDPEKENTPGYLVDMAGDNTEELLKPEKSEKTEAGKSPSESSDGDTADITLAELKEQRVRAIKKEKSRLAKQFREIDKKSRAVVDGLIEQAAFLRVQLQELADDININGTTELFAQGKDQEPYERQRPAANVYNSMNANYQKIIKQLNELLPKPVKNTEVKDGFRDFVNGRDVF